MFNEINSIKNKADFLFFINKLKQSLENELESWVNNDLSSYLEALSDWIEGIEQFYINTKQPIPENISWKVFADILMAAKMYE
ncbi:DUF7660 family protein [Thorsellia kenyensis]|uniref:DUF7660 domain-containing protein n=1 Tax=Thorsellia kenyensis TaxID=1549888 RepID=A0ABV6C721_9GAMM